ncbi:MAG: hypothetical protein O7C56_07960 [Rickettsia endosymbiont of Ixodes persulcatus]|nr:hypothetical protein [Rickettsia endosymbiont of Ixodes persulcatus]
MTYFKYCFKYLPVWLSMHAAMSAGVPHTTILPPLSPPLTLNENLPTLYPLAFDSGNSTNQSLI